MSTIRTSRRGRGKAGAGRVDRRGLWMGAGIFAAALFIRLVYLYESSDNPSFAAPIVDAQGYDLMARGLAAGAKMNEVFFWRAFFYPVFLSVVYALTGSSILWARVIQMILGSFTCVLVWRLGERVFGRRAGVWAALAATFYGPLIFYQGELLGAGWATFWSVAIILLFLRAAEAPSAKGALVLGLCGGLSVITRPTFLPFLLAGCGWWAVVWWRGEREKGLLARVLGTGLAGFLLITAPVAAKNYQVTGRLGILPANGGLNLYIGNNPQVSETLTARPGPDYSGLVDMPRREGITDIWAQQRFFNKKFFDYIRTEPGGFLKGLGWKTVQFFSSREVANSESVYVAGEWSWVLRMLTWQWGGFGFPFGVVFPLAVLGLVYYRRRIPGVLWLFVTFYPVSIILVHVCGRYRMPMVGPMVVLAAGGWAALAEMVRQGRRGMGAAALMGVAALAVLSSVAGPFCLEGINHKAELYYGVGYYRQKQGRVDEAVANYSEALAINNDYAEAHSGLAGGLLGQGKIAQAAEHYRVAIGIKPNWSHGQSNLAVALTKEGKFAEAIKYHREALRLDDDNFRAHDGLGVALARLGRVGEAIRHHRKALRLQGNWPEVLNNLAWLLATREEGSRGDYDEAVRLAQKACSLTRYEQFELLDTLAGAYAAAGRFAEAVDTVTKAIELARAAGQQQAAKELDKALRAYQAGERYRKGAAGR